MREAYGISPRIWLGERMLFTARPEKEEIEEYPLASIQPEICRSQRLTILWPYTIIPAQLSTATAPHRM